MTDQAEVDWALPRVSTTRRHEEPDALHLRDDAGDVDGVRGRDVFEEDRASARGLGLSLDAALYLA
jgi:hypothetical protein